MSHNIKPRKVAINYFFLYQNYPALFRTTYQMLMNQGLVSDGLISSGAMRWCNSCDFDCGGYWLIYKFLEEMCHVNYSAALSWTIYSVILISKGLI